ncbi:diguanylate cyclase domain-containing protein [Actinoplanes sp. GCM10030250]|uniref:diguanylate cyclase domain-containing protein n=1 Tax=Actinoplanes sp. GCM10030250 TaxID=3273376 RepID=UPI00360ED468
MRAIADDHDAEYWHRQIRVGGWLATGITLFGWLRIVTAWEPGLRWAAWLLALAAAFQTLLTLRPWSRLVRRRGVREVLFSWWVLELPVLYTFCMVDANGDALFLPGALLVITSAAALYPPLWVIGLGATSVLAFLALQAGPHPPSLTFTAAMALLLGGVATLSAMTAANRWRQDRRRRAAERRVEILLRNSSDAVVAVTADWRICYAGPSVRALLGYEPEALAGRGVDEFMQPEDVIDAHTWLHDVVQSSGARTGRRELPLRRADGSEVYVEAIAAAQTEDPALGVAVLSLRDVSARRALEEELTRRANTDPLTGLANRALFNERLDAALAGRQGFALLVIDLDGFKPINDTWGHGAGDEVLTETARRLSAHTRPGDTLARLGGDEFALLATGLDAAEADRLAALLTATGTEPIATAGTAVRCGLSVGATAVPAGDSTATAGAVLNTADEAMYAVKNSHRGHANIPHEWHHVRH